MAHHSLTRSLIHNSNTHIRSQHIHHAFDTPSHLARLNHDLHPLHQRLYQLINLLASAQLIGIQIQHYKRNIRSQLCNTIVGDVLDEPAQDRLKSEFIAIHKGGAERGTVAESGQEGYCLGASVVVLCGSVSSVWWCSGVVEEYTLDSITRSSALAYCVARNACAQA